MVAEIGRSGVSLAVLVHAEVESLEAVDVVCAGGG